MKDREIKIQLNAYRRANNIVSNCYAESLCYSIRNHRNKNGAYLSFILRGIVFVIEEMVDEAMLYGKRLDFRMLKFFYDFARNNNLPTINIIPLEYVSSLSYNELKCFVAVFGRDIIYYRDGDGSNLLSYINDRHEGYWKHKRFIKKIA